MRHSVTIFTTPGTTILSGPNEVVRLGVEMEHSLAKGVWYSRSLSEMPRATGVCRVEELLSSSNRICAVERVFVVVKCQEGFLGVVLDPTVSFVAGLPERIIGQANEDGLDPSQRHDPKVI